MNTENDIALDGIHPKVFPELIDYFERIVGRKWINRVLSAGAKIIEPNFWYRYLKTVRRWRNNGSRLSDIDSNRLLIQFGQFISCIQSFESDWKSDSCRGEFLHRLCNTEKAPGLLFELTTGINFKRKGFKVNWVGALGHVKGPDLRMTLDEIITVDVECIIKQPKFRRDFTEEEKAKALIEAASDKLDSKSVWTSPRLIVVKIPEQVEWKPEFQITLEKAMEGWFYAGRLSSVNGIYFLGGATGLRYYSDNQRSFVDEDQTVFYVENQFAQCKLPDDYRKRLRVRIT